VLFLCIFNVILEEEGEGKGGGEEGKGGEGEEGG